ncbi:MAG: hypothetical protein C5B52_11195 [Bacteroidetes bacterium]|nr:MAG: hypothetical protein C5B52_11195 [Bacteroidota bacterium]
MKPFSPSLEIMLVATSSFAGRQLCNLNDCENQSNLSPTEQLETACWNGLLSDMVPEIMKPVAKYWRLFLWEVEAGKNCIRVSLGAENPRMDNQTTIDPLYFLIGYNEN